MKKTSLLFKIIGGILCALTWIGCFGKMEAIVPGVVSILEKQTPEVIAETLAAETIILVGVFIFIFFTVLGTVVQIIVNIVAGKKNKEPKLPPVNGNSVEENIVSENQ